MPSPRRTPQDQERRRALADAASWPWDTAPTPRPAHVPAAGRERAGS